MIVRESFQALKQRKSQLEKKVNMFLDELGKVLWKDEHRLTLQEYEVTYLEEKCSKFGLPFKDIMSGFFVYAEKSTPMEVKEEYMIIHRSMKEFLCARAFCNEMISKGWDIMTVAGEWFKTARETLLQHEPSHRDLNNKYDCANLKMDEPKDVDVKREVFAFDNDAYFYHRIYLFCAVCHYSYCVEMTPESSDYYVYREHQLGLETTSYMKSNIYKCHIKTHIVGVWIFFVIGCLSSKQELNQERSEQLAFICFKLFLNYLCDYYSFLTYIKEAGNSLFTKMLSQRIKEVMWTFDSDHALEYAKELLQYVQPQLVHLHYCEPIKGVDPHKFLLESIDAFVNLPVNIHLDLRNFLLYPKSHLRSVKIYLKMILDDSKCSQLVSLMSPLDGETLKLLENVTSLKELRIAYCGDDLQQVKNVVKQLSQLEHLSIAIYPMAYMGLELSPLFAEGRNLPTFTLVLLEALCLDPQVLGAAVRKLCPDLSRIILHGNLAEVLQSFSIFSADFVRIIEYISAHITVITESLIHLELFECILDVPKTLCIFMVDTNSMTQRFVETLKKEHPHVVFKLSFNDVEPHMHYLDSSGLITKLQCSDNI